MTHFTNEPFLDFSLPAVRQEVADALARFESKRRAGDVHGAPLVGGRETTGITARAISDPSARGLILGTVRDAGEEDLKEALARARNATSTWRNTSAQQRAAIVRRAAALMRSRKYDLMALIIREAAKNWVEADADVGEAIDFCEFYAREAERGFVAHPQLGVPGEENLLYYEPRGVAVVIAPWNFPLAIACGMTVAALVTGNTTILKPAEQTSLVAFVLAQILLEAGIPGDAFSLLPGRGETIGRGLVVSPEVDIICFTGSRAVGLEIIRDAAVVHPGQRNVKRVIAEMGGKNCIIIDSDADFDDAVKGVVASAFGFAGQKCSACSRCVVVGDRYEEFLNRLAAHTKTLIVGPAEDGASQLTPVIDAEAQQRLLKAIRSGSDRHAPLVSLPVPADGCYVPATIFRDVPVTDPLWREELFGPVLCVRRAHSFDEALAVALDSPYALTGGVFSRSPANLDRARREFTVGNLYLNRKITGAMVGRQPFGGTKMSGVGSKAGGSDYLLQFVEPRVVTENTHRRGVIG